MIDYFALALTHALIVVALLRMVGRDALDDDDAATGDSERTAAKANRRRDMTQARSARPRRGRKRDRSRDA